VPLDPSFVGHSYPPTEPYLVSREKIREFADAIGELGGAYADVAAARALGLADLIAPPTFAVVITNAVVNQLRDDPALGLDFTRVVHGDQRFAHVRPILAGDRLTAVCTVEEILARAGHEFLTTRTDLTDENGAPVVSVWSKFVVRGDEGGPVA
jgi:acyl dehydratase